MKNAYYNPRKKSKGQAKMHPYLVAKMNEAPNSLKQAEPLVFQEPSAVIAIANTNLVAVGTYKQGQNKIIVEGQQSAILLSEATGMQIHYSI